jgi:beta-lactamase regulating signal transducer with metallopeptidase domain
MAMNDTLISILGEFFKGGLILCLGFLPGLFQRCFSAAERSFLWLVLFAVMLLLPLCHWLLPSWPMKLELRLPTEVLVSETVSIPAVQVQSSPPGITNQDGFNSLKFMGWIHGLYIAGALAVIAHRLLGSWQILGFCRRIHFLPESDERSQKLKQSGWFHVRLAVSKEIRVPMTWGVLSPVIVIPVAVESGCRSGLYAALEHEMAHVRHRDAARRWLGTTACALWWPLPLIWLAARAWRLEQERACDDSVILAGHDAGDYAAQLVEAACQSGSHSRPPASALVMAMPAGLEQRLRSIISPSLSRTQPRARFLAFSGMAGCMLLLTAGICRADMERPSSERGVCFKPLFVELTPSQARDAGLPEEGRITMPEKKTSVLLDLFSLNGKAKLMKLPKACAKLSQGAMMELHVGKGVVFPAELDKNGLHPASYGFEFPGFNVEVKPVGWTDHRCDVEVQARALRFHGFEIPSRPGRIVTDQPPVVLKGELARPVFHFRGWKGKVDITPGTWILQRLETLATSHPLALSLESEPREMWMFLCIEEDQSVSDRDAASQKKAGKP